MRSILLVLSLVSLIACRACGQIDIVATKYVELVGVSSPVVVGEKVFVETAPTITTRPVALLLVQSESDDIRVEASDVQRMPVKLAKIADGMWLLDSPGKSWIEAKEYVEIDVGGVKRKLMLDSKTIVVELGPYVPPGPGPGPDPGPNPPQPVGCDGKTNSNFDYLAKRACGWVNDVPADARSKRGDVAKVYLDASSKLADGKHLTINAASDAVRKQWAEVLSTPELKTAWGPWSTKANEELAKHWVDQSTNTAKREMMVQFFRSLGEGLQ